MKLIDISPALVESVTFNAVDLKNDDKGPYYSGRYKKVEKECWVCDGKGFEEYGEQKHPCEYCHGKGSITEEEDEGPELNVTNAAAAVITQMLGVDSDEHVGLIKYEEIPAKLQLLMKLKNSADAKQAYTSPDSVEQGRMGVDRSGDVPRIGRQGPTIHHGGFSDARIERYVDELINLLKYARDNKMHVSWA